MENKGEKELLQEIENLRKQVEKLKQRKKYGLVWDAEKEPEKVVLDCKSKIPLLIEQTDRSLGKYNNSPEVILIEGDNYHSLSVLNYTHQKKVDAIYIDPPYNTGNKDFIYNDNYVDSEDSYIHSKWISFMEKRLKLAKNLLTNDGVIFISIDDNELYNLKLLCDEIFGEKNFIANFVRKNKGGSAHDSTAVAIEFDYMLCYSRNKQSVVLSKEIADVENDPKYRLVDGHCKERGKYYLRDLDYKGSYSETLDYEINSPDGTKILPGGKKGKPNTWRWSSKKVEWGIKNEFIVFKKIKENWKVYIKQYQFVDNENKRRIRELPYRALIDFSNSMGSKDLKKIVDQNIFSYPKPVDLIKFILNLIPKKNCIVLDFFAGSGTTGQAVMEQNKKDNGKRQCILCTNNEGDICEKVCYPRLKTFIKNQTKERDKSELIFLKTELLDISDISDISDEMKIEITYKAGELLALKEGIFGQIEKNKWFQIFSNKSKHLGIYFREDKSELNNLIKKMAEMEGEKVVYIFSWSKNEYKNEFAEFTNIRFEDIPEPIIDVYKEVSIL